MKLCNFASLDPALKLRGIKGLAGASSLDRDVWNDFHRDLNEAAPASEDALRKLFNVDESSELEVSPRDGLRIHKRAPLGPTEVTISAKVRRGQDFFREAVINNSGGCCSLTRLAIRDLLVASHILPWRSHPEYRLEVRNGLCLSRLHDAAFDRGLIAFDEKFRLLLSPGLKAELSQRSVAENFGAYEGTALYFPRTQFFQTPRFCPSIARQSFRSLAGHETHLIAALRLKMSYVLQNKTRSLRYSRHRFSQLILISFSSGLNSGSPVTSSALLSFASAAAKASAYATR